MLGDIGDPQLIGLVAMKLSFDPVAGGGHTRDVTKARAPGDSSNASASHQHLDRQGRMQHRAHTSLGQLAPISRLNNVSGHYS
jgi:hypothetical protein